LLKVRAITLAAFLKKTRFFAAGLLFFGKSEAPGRNPE
jgi:hypothetical protein